MRYLVRAMAISLVFLLIVAWEESPHPAAAAPDDVLFSLTRVGNTAPWNCLGQAGVGVAFQPPSPEDPAARFRYSCQDPSTGQTSNVLQFLPYPDPGFGSPRVIQDAQGHNLPIEALAWDPNEVRLWFVNRIPVGPVSPGVIRGICAVWRLDSANKIAELAFTFGSLKGCNYVTSEPNFYDGLTIDQGSDTLYLSAAKARVIRHFNKDGTPAANDPIDFAALTAGICDGSSCTSSGLLAGVNGHLISATGEAGKLVEIDPAVPAVVAVYDSAAGRDWGLSCGPVRTLPDGSLTNTIASADLLSPNINVLQAPPGICDASDYAVRNAELLPGADFSAGLGEIAYRVLAAEYIGFGSDTIAAGDVQGSMAIILDWQFPPRRIIAAPGDRCLTPGGPPFNIFHYVPCAEGDTFEPGFDPPPPSIGGWACYDGADNDGDNLTDSADPECRYPISSVKFTVPATGEFQAVYRAVAFLCYQAGTTYGGDFLASASGVVKQTDITNDDDRARFYFHCG